jgi:hypothetical protein
VTSSFVVMAAEKLSGTLAANPNSARLTAREDFNLLAPELFF